MPNTKILGTGFYVPDKVVTNNDLAKLMTTTDEWITQRSGIKERRYVEDGVGAADLGLLAANRALEDAKLKAADIDFIIFATLSPDYNFPGSGCLLQDKLGVGPIGALDVRNQCTGFLYGLSIADQYIKTGYYKRILLVGAEVHSTGLEFADRSRDVSVLFGDGAGAVILGPTEEKGKGILSTYLHSEGKYAKKLWLEAPGSIYNPRLTHEMIEDGKIYPKMEGRFVFKHAVERTTEVINETLSKNGYTLKDVDLFIPHQANLRINQMVAMGLEIPEEKMVSNIQRYGNTTAGSIPIALDEARKDGRIKDGSLVMLVAFGAGFTWASALIRW